MAIVNAAGAAGNNGVFGPTSPSTSTTLPYATVSGTLAANSFTANKTTALRHSVAGTQGGSVANKSEVYSETMCLRTAYKGQDGDTGKTNDGTDTGRT